MSNPIGKMFRYAKLRLRHSPDLLVLPRAKGIIHVGANVGQERKLYDDYALSVLWVEPIPEVFAVLQSNIAGYERQRAVAYLVADRDGAQYSFHVANNAGESSSL